MLHLEKLELLEQMGSRKNTKFRLKTFILQYDFDSEAKILFCQSPEIESKLRKPKLEWMLDLQVQVYLLKRLDVVGLLEKMGKMAQNIFVLLLLKLQY